MVGTTTIGTAGRVERLGVQGMSDGSCVNFSFENGQWKDVSGFPNEGVGQQSSCGPVGELDSSSSSMAVGIDKISLSFPYSNIISSICHAISSVVLLIGSNDFGPPL